MCERSPKRLTRSCSSVEIKDNVTEPVQFTPVTQFDSPCTSVLSVSTLSPVCLIAWLMLFPEGNASSSDMWLAKYAELKYQIKLFQKGARLSWWYDPVTFSHSVSRIIIQFKQFDVIMTQFTLQVYITWSALHVRYSKPECCSADYVNSNDQIHASRWSSGDKAKWYGKQYYTNTTCLCLKNFHSNCVLPTKQLFLKDVQHCLATTRRTTSVSHVSKNQLHILLRPITLYPFWSLFKTWLTMKI